MVTYALLLQNKSTSPSQPWGAPMFVTETTLRDGLKRLGLQMGVSMPEVLLAEGRLSVLPFNSFSWRAWLVSGASRDDVLYTISKLMKLCPTVTETDPVRLSKLPVTCDDWERMRDELETMAPLASWEETVAAEAAKHDTPFDMGEISRLKLAPLLVRVASGRVGGPEDGE